MRAMKYFFLSLKHPAYHVGLALSVLFGFSFLFPELWSVRGLAISLAAAFAIDVIDHPICIFLYGRGDRFARRVRRLIWRSPVLAARVYGRHHKRIEGLLIHSFPGLGLTWAVLITVNLYTDLNLLKLAVAQVVAHQLFDVADDWAILGHVHNWELWRHRPRFSTCLTTILVIVVLAILLFGLFGGHFAHAGWSSFFL